MTATKRKFLWGFGSFFLCLILYLSIAFLMLGRENIASDSPLEGVPYEKEAEPFSILLCADDLGQYCSLTVYPADRSITATLFNSREDALFYEKDHTRYINYSKKTEIDIIGRIGGIVIEDGNSYNKNSSTAGRQRIFGTAVLKLAESDSFRIQVAREILCSLMETPLDETDFNLIFATTETDISYIDFCEYFPLLRECSENITVTMG